MFGAWSIYAAWQFIFGWAGFAILIGVSAVAVAIMTPPAIARFIPNLRMTAIIVAITAFSFTTIAGKYYADGLDVKQSEWDQALGREADNGNKARSDAVRTLRDEPPDGVRLDPRNRDNWRQKSSR